MSRQLVLFVDDDANLLQSWRRTFRQEEYEMLFARSTEEALSILKGIKVAVVVSDYSMPKKSGLELLATVRDRYPDMARILVSGHATLAVARRAINRCQVHRLFEKPCNVIELGMVIREALTERMRSSNSQDALVIADLETEHPGIMTVIRDEDGAIKL